MEMMFMCRLFACVLLLVHPLVLQSKAQQPYINNRQLDCDNHAYDNLTKGFRCNLLQTCESYLTFRSNTLYNSAAEIANLLGATPSQVVSINNLTLEAASLPVDTQLVVPVKCSCSGDYYQHNVTYQLRETSETYFIVSNNTFQGLTSCQAMMAQNKYGSRNLYVGLDLLVPLRCACPTRNQTASGVKYLLSYLVTWGNSISYIADLFGVQQQAVLDANELTEDQNIYPFTPILVPLKTQPTKIQQSQTSSPPAPAPQSPSAGDSGSSNKWVFVGVGLAAGLLLLVSLLGLVFYFHRRRSTKTKTETETKPVPPKKFSESSTDYSALPDNSNSKSFPNSSASSQGFRDAVESLTVYKFQDLQLATVNFSEYNRIQGSVYKGSIKGDDAAIKVMKGDVSSEINLLKKINHSKIIRLSGFCVHQGNTYLVYEYADNGAVNDWLHSNKLQTLSWKQRVQIAYDVANALNYLHRYTNPPYIHKNLKTSNILLDANFRAKVANFGLARSVDANDQGGLQLTRHVVGTYGYMPPEYIEHGVITPKLDVFAFGVVVLELLSAREAASGDKNSGEELLSLTIDRVLEGDNVREKLRGFIDPSLKNAYPLDLAFSIAQLARSCVARDLNARPSMSDVFINLSRIVSSLSEWDPSDELDNSRSLSSGR